MKHFTFRPRSIPKPKTFIFTLVVGLALLSSSQAQAQPERTIQNLLDRLSTSPTIEEVQRHALRQASLEPEKIGQMLSRVRVSGMLPRVEAIIDRGISRDEDLDRDFQEMDELSLTTDQDLEFRVTVRWDLDRLIYDSEELRARREAVNQAQRRRELLLSVTRIYYELLLLRAQQRLATNEDQQSEVERIIRISELTSLLDGLTGGLMTRSGL